ncbi:MAG: urease accessory UreF family protein [Myxococcota bacterium]
MTEPAGALGLLQLLRLASPSLPVGAFTGSEALEYAVLAGWVRDEASALDWIGGRLRRSLPALDVPLLRRFQAAWCSGAEEPLARWSAYLRASRESAELWQQDQALGRALARLLVSLGCSNAEPWIENADANYPCSFALAAHYWNIPPESAAAGYVYAWCENQVAAAVKLVPLGHTTGQRLLGALIPDIPKCVREGFDLGDSEIGSSEPGLAIASALHETQYSRLFRA